MAVTNEELEKVIITWMEGYETAQMLANRIRVRYIQPLERELEQVTRSSAQPLQTELHIDK